MSGVLCPLLASWVHLSDAWTIKLPRLCREHLIRPQTARDAVPSPRSLPKMTHGNGDLNLLGLPRHPPPREKERQPCGASRELRHDFSMAPSWCRIGRQILL